MSDHGQRMDSLDEVTLAADDTVGRRGEVTKLERGRTIGRYVVLDQLGAGGMGVVYTGYDPELDRRVAIKLLHAAPGGGSMGSTGHARLVREAQAIAKISHPNVVAVHDVGTFEGRVFVAMEFVAGKTLSEWLEGEHSQRRIVEVFLEAGRGLAAAHAAGIIHRDFKPDNVLIGDDGRVRVLDFGLARAPAESRDAEELAATGEDDVLEGLSSASIDIPLTATGAIMGTPAYMAPEQHLRGENDARTDQFAFCVALWEALYGQRPFGGETIAALAFQVAQGKIREPPRDARVPAHVRRALERGLARKREDRFPDMPALLAELARDPAAARRRWASVGAVLATIGVVSWLAYRGGEQTAGKVCSGGEDKLTGVWDADRTAKLKTAFDDSGLAYAADSWSRTQVVIDEWVAAWTATHRDACEATRVRGEQSEQMLDLRMACLESRRRDLAATVELLGEPDQKIVTRSVQLAYGLPSVADCSDLERLSAAVEPPTPEQAERVAALRERASRLEARQKAGKFDDAVEQAKALVSDAREVGYMPLVAEALDLSSDALDETGADGVEEGQEAFLVALECGHDDVAIAAAFSLAHMLGAGKQKFEEGERWLRIGESLSGRTGREPDTLIPPVNTRAIMAMRAGDFERARELFTRVAELARTSEDVSPTQLSSALGNLGSFHAQRGEFDQAVAAIEEAIAVASETLGPKHPTILEWKANLGAIAVMRGDVDTAQSHLEEVLALQLEVLGDDTPAVANTMQNLAIVYRRQNELEKSEQMHRRALELRERTLGPEHPDVASSLLNLASAVMEQDRAEEALELLERSRQVAVAALGPDHPSVARAHGGMANALRRLDRREEALAHSKKTVELFEAKVDENHVDLVEPLLNYSIDLRELGRAREAVAPAERALKITLATPEADPSLLASARAAVARAITGKGRANARARELVEQALAYYAEAGAREADTHEKLEAWLAAH